MADKFTAVCPIKNCEKLASYKLTKKGTQYSFFGLRHGHRGFMDVTELHDLVADGTVEPKKPIDKTEISGINIELQEADNGSGKAGDKDGWGSRVGEVADSRSQAKRDSNGFDKPV